MDLLERLYRHIKQNNLNVSRIFLNKSDYERTHEALRSSPLIGNGIAKLYYTHDFKGLMYKGYPVYLSYITGIDVVNGRFIGMEVNSDQSDTQ